MAYYDQYGNLIGGVPGVQYVNVVGPDGSIIAVPSGSVPVSSTPDGLTTLLPPSPTAIAAFVPPVQPIQATVFPTLIGPPIPGGSMPAVIPVSAILKILTLLATVVPIIKTFLSGQNGSVLSLDNLPNWARDLILVAGGIAAGTVGISLLHDLLAGGGGAAAVPAGFTKAWNANGVQFYRNNTTGMLGVVNTRGRWKQWRPRHPIVIYSGGAGNLRTFIRAAKAIHKQANALQAVVRREFPPKPTARAQLRSAAQLKRLAEGHEA